MIATMFTVVFWTQRACRWLILTVSCRRCKPIRTRIGSLAPFGGKFDFGEDRMRLTHKTPETFLAAQIPPVLRKMGMALEHSIYLNNFCRRRLRTARHGLPTGMQRQTSCMARWLPLRGNHRSHITLFYLFTKTISFMRLEKVDESREHNEVERPD